MTNRYRGHGRAAIGLLLALASGTGCSEDSASGSASNPSKPPSAAPSGAAAPKPSDEADSEQLAPDHVRTKTYHLRAIAETQYQKGKLGQLSVELKPREGWHVNMDYPFSVEVMTSEGVQVPKQRLEKADAVSYSEGGVRLDVPFTPQAVGERELRMEVDFAVCTPDSCVPDRRRLAVRFRVDG